MNPPRPNPRTPDTEIDAMFCDRWSPRSYSDDPVSEEDLQSLFEAARWAPSCYNEQPWLFIYAATAEDRARFATALVEKNRRWAERAPVLLFVLARRRFALTGKENRHAPFDAGAAWMSLALQARKRGLYTHGMAGFSQERAYELLGVSEEDYHIMAAVALGRRGAPEVLPENLLEMEAPNNRKPHAEVAMEGKFRQP
ncbi:MAG: nitroreductase family protein [Desulfuromonadales bacterium]|jgi:nitroreductase